MEKEIILGNRVLLVRCIDKKCDIIVDTFLKLIKKIKPELAAIMNKQKIPRQIVVTFTKGDTTLEGLYHLQSRLVSKHIIAIDIFTEHWEKMRRKEIETVKIKSDIISTFIHELIHHNCKSEKETERKTEEYMKDITPKLID